MVPVLIPRRAVTAAAERLDPHDIPRAQMQRDLPRRLGLLAVPNDDVTTRLAGLPAGEAVGREVPALREDRHLRVAQ